MLHLYTDKALLDLIAEGDEKAFRVFFDRYKDRFYAVVLKMTGSGYTAEEMVQDIFLQIWRNRATLKDILKPESYFFTSLYRQVFKHYKQLALTEKALAALSDEAGHQYITDQTILARESERLINEAIARLPQQQQLIFKMNKLEGLNRNEIAEKLQLSPNTVRNHLAEAIKSVKAHLSNTSAFYMFLVVLFTRK